MGICKKGDPLDRDDLNASDDGDSDSDSSDVSSDSSDDDSSDFDEPSASTSQEKANDDSEDDEDEVIKAIKREAQKERDHPPIIVCEDFIVDLSFHPQEDMLAIALITGDVLLYNYTNNENTLKCTLELHTDACRSIEFSQNGALLYSTSKDKSIMITDVESGKLKQFFENAHDEPIYCLSVLDENLIATGDDSGVVRLWDLREAKNPVFKAKKHEDYISDIVSNESLQYLICSSGDGTISAFDLQNRKFLMQSEEYEEEMTCMCLMRSESKLLAGSSRGKLLLYNWNEFGLHSDIFPGPKHAINDMVPITEDIVVTACEDGILRATHLYPHRHLGIVGQHEMSVENVDISNNGKFIASSCHNNNVKFWNIQYFEDFEKMSHKHNKNLKRKEMENNLPSSKRQNVSDFFKDLS